MADPRTTILYLDDDEGNLSVFQAAFLRHYDVHVVSTPDAAFEVLRTQPVKVLLTDQRMPILTGIEFLKQVIPLYPDIIRIIVTAYSDLEVVVQAINECSIFRYITKPWNTDDLRQTLENAVETYRLREENRRLLHDLQQTNAQLEETVEELQGVNGELSAYTLQLVQKNENILEIRDKLQEVAKNMEANRQAVSQAIQSIAGATKADRYWEDFMLMFEKMQSGFFSRLKVQYPELTPNELKLSALLKMNMSSKEIANLLGISHHSVNVARYRLRKKLGLDSDQGLEEILMRV